MAVMTPIPFRGAGDAGRSDRKGLRQGLPSQPFEALEKDEK